MNVLSLFDGISCGMVALERAGIPVERYVAYEIEEDAIKVSKHNYPQIEQKGDVFQAEYNGGEFDLLIGGSPCQGFSFAGKQLNFDDPRSKLFFEFVDILNHIKKHNPNVKFLLENVGMKKEYEEYFITPQATDPAPNKPLFGAKTEGSMPKGEEGAVAAFTNAWGFAPKK